MFTRIPRAAWWLVTILAVCGCNASSGENAPPRADSPVKVAGNSGASAEQQPAPEPVDPVVQALIEALGDSDGAVRRQAAEGLMKRQAKAAVPALMNRVADDVWIEKKRFVGTNNAADPIDGGKAAALEALRQLAPDKVAEALRRGQKSKNAHVRTWATQELTHQ